MAWLARTWRSGQVIGRSACLMCCQMRSFRMPKRSPEVIAKLRGRGRSTQTSSTTRPGRALSTTTRSAR